MVRAPFLQPKRALTRVAFDSSLGADGSAAAQLKRQAPGSAMSSTQDLIVLHGSCHCGCIEVDFSTFQVPATISPRVCDCSFCRKHGAAYISDPAGKLRLTIANPGAVRTYRQGSEVARFQLCGECGVLLAVTFKHGGRVYGAVNATCLDGSAILGVAVSATPQLLSSAAKVARWLQAWVPDVQFVVAGA